MVQARTLHVRCATWEQVDVFTTRKLRKGKLLSMKVPFETQAGAPLTLGLELPNLLVVAIDGIVQRASLIDPEPGAKPDQARTWIELELTGLTDEVMGRIRAMASEELARSAQDGLDERGPPVPSVTVRRATSSGVDELAADERELFQQLSSELRRMRGAAVHDVLGVPADANSTQVRASWKNLIRRHHPDLVARRAAPAISHLAEELTILANRAYDRLRAALVAEGGGTIIGPTLTASSGWLVGFEDIASVGAVARSSPPRLEPTPEVTPRSPPSATVQGADAFEARARSMLANGDADNAREVLAAALVVFPRSRSLRALYLVATALVAVLRGEVMLAISQLETALAHHDQSVEAAMLLEHVKKHGADRPEQMRRVFQ